MPWLLLLRFPVKKHRPRAGSYERSGQRSGGVGASMQAGRANRIALADDVIENTSAEDALDQTVADLHRHYLQLAAPTP